MSGGGSSARLALAQNGIDATRPAICYHTTIYIDSAKKWGCETSSVYREAIVEHEARPGARSVPSETKADPVWPYHVSRNQCQTFGSVPQLCQRPVP